MDKRQKRKYEIHFATTVLIKKRLTTGIERPLQRLCAEFRRCVDRLREVRVSQTAGLRRRNPKSPVYGAREQLRAHMVKIAGVARLPSMRGVPGIELLKRVPPGRERPARMAAAAKAMAKAINRDIEGAFEEQGWAPGMAKRLNELARAVRETTKADDAAANTRSYATVEIKRLFTEAGLLRNAIRAMLQERMMTDSTLEAEWDAMTRIGRTRGRPTKRRRAAKGQSGGPA